MTVEQFFAVVGSGYTDDDAAVIGPELDRLSSLGMSSRDDIVVAATPEASLLHGYFEWDDAIAARQHRVTQAGHLARSIRVIVRDDDGVERDMRAFYSVVRGDGVTSKRQYVSIHTVLQERSAAAQVISEGWRNLCLWRARYRDYDEVFSRVFEAIDETEQRIPAA